MPRVRWKGKVRREELSKRVMEHCIFGHDDPFLDSTDSDGERTLEDVSETYFKNAEALEAENRKERGLYCRSAAWWALVGVPKHGLRRQLVQSDAKPIPPKGSFFGMPRCWTDRPEGGVEVLFESEGAYLARNRLLTPEEVSERNRR